MSSPLPPVPGETDGQKKVRLAGAYRKQAEVDAERRAEEAARGQVVPPPVRTEMPPPITQGPMSPKAPPTMRPTGMDKGPMSPKALLKAPPTKGPDRQQKMAPIRRAAGGAAKVRKGMMTSEGVITNAMNKVRGK